MNQQMDLVFMHENRDIEIRLYNKTAVPREGQYVHVTENRGDLDKLLYGYVKSIEWHYFNDDIQSPVVHVILENVDNDD